MPDGADKGAASGGDPDGKSPEEQAPHLEQENPDQLNPPMAGPSVNPETLKTPSVSKATSPMKPLPEPDPENLRDSELPDVVETMIKEIGPFVTRLKFEETKSQYEQLGEVMKERAILTMMECLNLQHQQQQRAGPSKSGPIHCQDVISKRSLSTLSSCNHLRNPLAPQSVRTLKSEGSFLLQGKPSVKLNKLVELEKQVNNLEKQCRIVERHLREHNRDQKSMQMKIHCLEMKVLQDGQKQMIWDMIEKIPTDEDLKTIESFYSFALERKRTESQIKVLNVKVNALNAAMGKMSIDPLQIDKNVSLDWKRTSQIRAVLPDFTRMSLQEREEFFRRAGVTLYEYDQEAPEPEVPQKRSKRNKPKRVSILNDQADAQPRLKTAKRKRGNDEGNDAQNSRSSKLKTSKSAKSSKLDGDNWSDQNIRFGSGQALVEVRPTSELISSLAAERPLGRTALSEREGSAERSDSIGSEEIPEENQAGEQSPATEPETKKPA